MNIQWIKIPEGQFTFGLSEIQARQLISSAHASVSTQVLTTILKRELPQQIIHLPTYYISRYPITHRQFAEFVSSKPYLDRPAYHEPSWSEHPVTCSWHLAYRFCAFIDARLPTVYEWEKAARGVDGRLYPWGDEWGTTGIGLADKHLGHSTEGILTRTVGNYEASASPFAVEDLIGNNHEWTLSSGLTHGGQSDSPYRQMFLIRGSSPNPDSQSPFAHRVTRLDFGGLKDNSWPPYTGFRPVMDKLQYRNAMQR